MQLRAKIKTHHYFPRWQRDSSAWVFLGWQTPALIRAWMMSSIHYAMIKSLPLHPPNPQPHHCYEPDIHQGPVAVFLAGSGALGDQWWGRTSLLRSQPAPQRRAWWVKGSGCNDLSIKSTSASYIRTTRRQWQVKAASNETSTSKNRIPASRVWDFFKGQRSHSDAL